MKPLALAILLLTGCATTARFSDRPILWRDPDGLPIARPSTPEPTGIHYAGFRDAVVHPMNRALALDYGREAVNVNALDEVPDSSWWVDRRRAGLEGDARLRPRAFTAEEISRGPFGEDPGPVAPYKIIKGKTIGSTPGLVIVDARGKRYMFKLDPPGWIGLNTSTEVVATRLAWAAGWLVPAEMIVDVRPDELVLAPDAHTKDSKGKDIPLTRAMVDDLLRRTPREPDGRLRVCAGRWLDGRSLGPWHYTGRREDDPNDRIPHQDRRDVRAFGVFTAWVNDIDTMENNTLDMYAGADGKGHVVHYQQDVGGAFGQFAAVPAEAWMGEETFFMPDRIFASLLTLGLLPRAFDDDTREGRRRWLLGKYPQLGYFDDEGFDPRDWHPILDNPAFVRMTMRDRYWGAKQIIAFTPEEVRAAVALGHYPPATAERLFQILWHRRDAIARSFLSETAPLDYFHFQGTNLCFDDLRLAGPGAERCMGIDVTPGYHVVELDGTGRLSPRSSLAAASDARDKALRSRRPPTVKVHYVAAGKSLRVVGIER